MFMGGGMENYLGVEFVENFGHSFPFPDRAQPYNKLSGIFFLKLVVDEKESVFVEVHNHKLFISETQHLTAYLASDRSGAACYQHHPVLYKVFHHFHVEGNAVSVEQLFKIYLPHNHILRLAVRFLDGAEAAGTAMMFFADIKYVENGFSLGRGNGDYDLLNAVFLNGFIQLFLTADDLLPVRSFVRGGKHRRR